MRKKMPVVPSVVSLRRSHRGTSRVDSHPSFGGTKRVRPGNNCKTLNLCSGLDQTCQTLAENVNYKINEILFASRLLH